MLSLALVPVKLLLEVGLGILDAHQCAQRSLECLTANRTDSDGWNASEILYDPKSAFCHVYSLLQAASHCCPTVAGAREDGKLSLDLPWQPDSSFVVVIGAVVLCVEGAHQILF
jgi:hypothetical protein